MSVPGLPEPDAATVAPARRHPRGRHRPAPAARPMTSTRSCPRSRIRRRGRRATSRTSRREQMLQFLPQLPALVESGRMLPLIAADAEAAGRSSAAARCITSTPSARIVEIGYWLLPQARGRGVATQIARLLAEHSFSLGVQRVEAYVNVGNGAVGARPRARPLHARGRRPLVAEARRIARRQDAVLAAPRRVRRRSLHAAEPRIRGRPIHAATEDSEVDKRKTPAHQERLRRDDGPGHGRHPASRRPHRRRGDPGDRCRSPVRER